MTDNQIFKSSIRPALNDREWMLDSLGNTNDNSGIVQEEIKQIAKLANRRFSALKDHERRYAMLALLYAEQWEDGFADSCSGRPESKDARKRAQQFKELRHRIFGKTRFEKDMETAATISLESLISQKF